MQGPATPFCSKEKKTIKVAYIIGGLPFGGVEHWLLDVVLQAPLYAIAPYVINLSGTGEMLPLYQKNNVPLICLNNSNKSLNSHRVDTIIKLHRALKEISPDILHMLHFSGGYFGRLANIPKKYKNIVHIRNTKIEPKKHRIYANKILSYTTDSFLSVSKEVKEKCVSKTHNSAQKPSKILYNAIDTKRLEQKAFTKDEFGVENSKVIAGIGRLVEQKNFDLLIKSFALYKKKTNCPSNLFIIGDGPLKNKLKQLAYNLNIRKHVHFLGYRTDVPALLSIIDLLIMPSSYEGLPIAHLEAMYKGIPTIISPHVPSKEIAGESTLVIANNQFEIANATEMILKNKEKYKNMSKIAKEIAKNFTVENHMKKIRTEYETILS